MDDGFLAQNLGCPRAAFCAHNAALPSFPPAALLKATVLETG